MQSLTKKGTKGDKEAFIIRQRTRAGLRNLIEAMQKEEWCVPNAADGHSHTGPMALAEIMIKLLVLDISDLDYDEETAGNKKPPVGAQCH